MTADALVAGTLESHLAFVCPGVTVRRAQTVSAAVSAQASEPPDAVLADLAMLDASDLVDLTRPVSPGRLRDPPPGLPAPHRRGPPVRRAGVHRRQRLDACPGEIAGVRTELKGVRTELKEEIAAVRTELRKDIADLSRDLSARFLDLGTQIQVQFEALHSVIATTREGNPPAN